MSPQRPHDQYSTNIGEAKIWENGFVAYSPRSALADEFGAQDKGLDAIKTAFNVLHITGEAMMVKQLKP